MKSIAEGKAMAENRAAVEPWMRGTHEEIPAVQRAVIHALELAREDVERWCGHLTDEEWNLHPQGLAPAAFHVRHIAQSIDRLLTYAEGGQLSGEQLERMKYELDPRANGKEVLAEFEAALAEAEKRIRAFAGNNLEAKRALGRKALPTTVGGLLVHVADHTSRHVGQVVTTAKLAVASRGVF
jgi:uncharacterized damage-inducible protein DinB